MPSGGGQPALAVAEPAGHGKSRWSADETAAVERSGYPGRNEPSLPAMSQNTNTPGFPGQPVAPVGDAKVQRQVQQQAGVGPVSGGGGTLFSEPVLVVNQKAKLIELTNEYAVFDQQGATLGSVVQVGQSGLRKAVRLLTSLDQYLTHKLEIRDAHGSPVLLLTRPAKFIKSRVVVQLPNGQEVGQIVQQNAIGKINFALEVGGRKVGAVKAENWRAWNFSIVDETDAEIARITKTWEGLAKTMFTTADNYVLQIHRPLADPLLSLVVATALTVDTALKQDARGLG
ncbi:phospholipid scramblase-related protein [Kitasatospora sp. NPDC057965]|uniref:phospholipid scramblase-related protein n=1 Tax=Kitasatospora sp. NPDC057965 TaxID=3346291 RepID=UPI0036DCEF2D